tara:strand:+ start:918 stop:1649 length:732 start_codon:yes stop_codon:yes gene_type:complete
MKSELFKKETTIYWAYANRMQIRCEEPSPVIQNYFAKDKKVHQSPAQELEYIKCPSFRAAYKNTFGLRSVFKYSLDFKNGDLSSKDNDQLFYDEFVFVRNADAHEASLGLNYVFIAEADDMEMEYRHAAMENNSFNKSSILIPGNINVGKYVRVLECAFHMREDKMEIDEGDIYAYVKFKTDKKVNLKQFLWKPEITEPAVTAVRGVTEYRDKSFKPLDWYYKKQQKIKVKERTLEMVKSNLL